MHFANGRLRTDPSCSLSVYDFIVSAIFLCSCGCVHVHACVVYVAAVPGCAQVLFLMFLCMLVLLYPVFHVLD